MSPSVRGIEQASKWLERVVGDLARPDERPQRLERLRGVAPYGSGDLLEEDRPALFEQGAHLGGDVAFRVSWRGGEERFVLREEQRDPSVARPEWLHPGPDDSPRGGERVEVPRTKALDPRGENPGVEGRDREGAPLELPDRLDQRVAPSPATGERLPLEQEAAVGGGVDRLDLLPQLRERLSANRAEDLRFAELPPRPVRQKGPLDELSALHQPRERALHAVDPEPEAGDQRARHERAVRPGPAEDEISERVFHRLEKSIRRPARRHDPDRVAVAPDVLARDEPLLPRDRDLGDPALLLERADPLGHVRRRLRARLDFGGREIAEREKKIVNAVGVLGRALEPLEHSDVRFDRVGIEELPQLRFPQQLAQLRVVDRERLGAALGERGVAVVDEVGDEREEERGGEGGRRARIAGGDADLARLDAPENLDEGREIEDVAKTLPVRLENDRERGILGRDREQVMRALALGLAGSAFRGSGEGEGARARRLRESARRRREVAPSD